MLTARRRDGETSRFALGCAPDSLGELVSILWMNGLRVVRSERDHKTEVSAGMMFFHEVSVCLLLPAGDVRMLVRAVLFGARRIARHLWRMCVGLFQSPQGLFPGTLKPPPEIAFRQWGSATSIPALFSHNLV